MAYLIGWVGWEGLFRVSAFRRRPVRRWRDPWPGRNNDCRLYVGNLPPDIRTKDIEDVFYKYGAIRDIDLQNRRGGPPFAFVEFEDQRDAEDGVYGLYGCDYGYRLRGPRHHSSIPRHIKSRVLLPGSFLEEAVVQAEAAAGGGGGGAPRGHYGPASRRSKNRVVVSELPPSGSWPGLKDHMREGGDVCYAEVYRDGTGVVEFVRKEDMTYAVRKLDNTKFRSHEGETAYIRVKGDGPRSPSYGRSRSRSRRPKAEATAGVAVTPQGEAEDHHAILPAIADLALSPNPEPHGTWATFTSGASTDLWRRRLRLERKTKVSPARGTASPGSRGPRPHPDPGSSLTRIQGHTASPRPRIQLHPDPGAHGLTQTQGRVASPGPGTQPYPDPGAHGLARTRDLASPGPRGTWPHPDPGARGLSQTQGRVASPGSRGPRPHPDPGPRLTRIQGPTASPGPGARLIRIQGPTASPGPGARLTRIQGPTASPGPGTQAHPDPGAHGLTRTRDPGSPGSRGPRPHPDPGPGSPGSRGPRPHPDPGPSLTRIQGHTASPRPRIQLHLDPGAHGLTRTQGRVASPGPGTQPHPDPGAHGLARTWDLAFPGPRGTLGRAVGPRVKSPPTRMRLKIMQDPAPASPTPIGQDPDSAGPTPFKPRQAGAQPQVPVKPCHLGAQPQVPRQTLLGRGCSFRSLSTH
ncbi:hypothetical protein QTO34_000503, partial [Cnephaeus nilssonii]